MNKKEQKYQIVQEALILLTVITLLSFVCRLWALILLCILALIVATVRLLFLKAKSDNDRVEEHSRESTDKATAHQDLYTMAYSLILDQITSLVDNEFEGAKWVWETQNPKKNIEHGADVFIILNGAGGYRRAKVRIVALRAIGLEFQSVSEDNAKQEQKNIENAESEMQEEVTVNYELIAFEWVDSHILELNNRLNQAIGDGKDNIILSPSELPVRECWDKLCDELTRAEVNNAECTDDGIIIKFKSERQKGNQTDEYRDREFI